MATTRAYEVLRTTVKFEHLFSKATAAATFFYRLDATLNGFLIVRGGLIPWFSEPAKYKLGILEMKKTETCYMCNREASSREHVPPKCFFPDRKDLPVGIDFRRNLITVPSCDEHNLGKSADDEFLLFIVTAQYRGSHLKDK